MRYRHTVNLFFVALHICVLLRTIQLFFTIDSGTGFIKQQYSTISSLITIIVCATIAVIGLLATASDGIEKKQTINQIGVSLCSLLLGGAFIYEALTSLLIKNTSSWHDMLLAFFCVLSALIFMIYGLKNVFSYSFPLMLLTIPVVCYVAKLINIFVSTSSLALVVENVFFIFTNSAVLWFMFEFASFENQIGDMDKKPKALFASGLTAVMLCAVSAFPKMFLFLGNKATISKGDIATTILNIVVGLFIFTYIITYFCDKEKKDKKVSFKHSA